ncbi:hypothetical protein PAXINDRAFT_180644 [Paxillus involutus ATCC 200175]|uniref:Unplaced genomic scaffold PAXINscaffold_14, whole genome shotgun sequence n=1 Tax=Paxillus involutus ATCC 200175 TaxID=664439 RepID=A0A0C9TZ55_PAXIN|nr:hypothetical protein PAXINDRAFT_180644 [Paxillus involutus ATCC 200175]
MSVVVVTVTVTPTSTPTSSNASSTVNPGTIAGIVIGVLLGGVLLIGAVLYLLNRRHRGRFTRVANPAHEHDSGSRTLGGSVGQLRSLVPSTSRWTRPRFMSHSQHPSVSLEPLMAPVPWPSHTSTTRVHSSDAALRSDSVSPGRLVLPEIPGAGDNDIEAGLQGLRTQLMNMTRVPEPSEGLLASSGVWCQVPVAGQDRGRLVLPEIPGAGDSQHSFHDVVLDHYAELSLQPAAPGTVAHRGESAILNTPPARGFEPAFSRASQSNSGRASPQPRDPSANEVARSSSPLVTLETYSPPARTELPSPPPSIQPRPTLFIHRLLKSRAQASEPMPLSHQPSLAYSQSRSTTMDSPYDQADVGKLLADAESRAVRDAEAAHRAQRGVASDGEDGYEDDPDSPASAYSQLSASVDHEGLITSDPFARPKMPRSLDHRKSSRRRLRTPALPTELPSVAEVPDTPSGINSPAFRPPSTVASSSLHAAISHGQLSRPQSLVQDHPNPFPLLTSTAFGKSTSSGTSSGSISSGAGRGSNSSGRASRYPSLAASSLGQSSGSQPHSEGGVDWHHPPAGLAGLKNLQIAPMQNPHSPVEPQLPSPPSDTPFSSAHPASEHIKPGKRAHLRGGTSSSIPEVERRAQRGVASDGEDGYEDDPDSPASAYSQLSASVDHEGLITSDPFARPKMPRSLDHRKSSRRRLRTPALPTELPSVAEVPDTPSGINSPAFRPPSTVASSSLHAAISHGQLSRPQSLVQDHPNPFPLLTSTAFGKSTSSGTSSGSISSGAGRGSNSSGRASRYPSLAASSLGQSSGSQPHSEGGVDWHHPPAGLAGLKNLQIAPMQNPHSPVEPQLPSPPSDTPFSSAHPASEHIKPGKRAHLRGGTSSSIPEVERRFLDNVHKIIWWQPYVAHNHWQERVEVDY